MNTIFLTDITGVIGEWLDDETSEIDPEVSAEIVELLAKAYRLASEVLDDHLS